MSRLMCFILLAALAVLGSSSTSALPAEVTGSFPDDNESSSPSRPIPGRGQTPVDSEGNDEVLGGSEQYGYYGRRQNYGGRYGYYAGRRYYGYNGGRGYYGGGPRPYYGRRYYY